MTRISPSIISMLGLNLFKGRRRAPEEKPAPQIKTRRRFRSYTRIYKAAQTDRLTMDWLSQGADLNLELKSQMRILRARARAAEQNSCLARRYLSLHENNLVGPNGFALQVLGRDAKGGLDKENNKLVAVDFKKWAKRGVCEITGRYSFRECQRILARSAPRDGEVLVRLHDVKPAHKNPWGFVIELLDPARLDERLNTDLKNGNRIRLGIEVNTAGQAVAYHLKRGERMGLLLEHVDYERVPAENIIHWFRPDQPEQLRGVTWMVAGLVNLHQQDKYQETAIVAARSGASKMGWIQSDSPPDVMADGEDENGELYEELEAGVIGHLNRNETFVGFDPKYPHENYDPFMKTNTRSLAVGWEVSYHSLTDDLADVNFSSIRTGVLNERDAYKTKQDSFSAILERIYERWLISATYNGQFGKTSQETWITKFSDHHWRGRRWDWVNPKDDIAAVVMAINAGLGSPQRYAAEMGIDIEDLIEEIAAFKELCIKHGITLSAISIDDKEQANDDTSQAAKTKAAA